MADPIIKHNSTCPSLPLDLSDLGCFRLFRNVTLLTLRICKYPFETEFVRKCYIWSDESSYCKITQYRDMHKYNNVQQLPCFSQDY